MHRSQIFSWLLLSFIAGVFIGSFFSVPQPYVIGAILICSLLIAIFFRRGSKVLSPRLTFGAFCILFILFGILCFNLRSAQTHVLEKFGQAYDGLTNNVAEKNKFKVVVLGYISDEPTSKGDKQTFRLQVSKVISADKVIATDEGLLVTTRLYPTYHYGQSLKIEGFIQLPKNYADSEFDYISYLAKDGIFTVSYYPTITDYSMKFSALDNFKIKIYQKIFAIKTIFVNSINRSVTEPSASYISGILLGARTQIPPDIKTAFARTSTSHILAISGYNIAIIVWVISAFFLLFFKRTTAFWLTIIGIIFFTIITGAQASVVRAAIMGVVALVAYRQGRLYNVGNAIIAVGAVMVLINPQILRFDVGFQLSFAGTLGLVVLYPILDEKLTWLPKLFTWLGLRETLLMTTSAQLFVLPLLLYYFKTLSVVSLPANLLILPTIPYTMFLGFVMAILGMLVPFLGQLVGYLVWLMATIEIGIIKLLAEPSWAAPTVSFPWYLLVASYLLIIIFIYVYKRRAAKADN